MANRRRSVKQTTDLIVVMGKLMVFWSVFLLLFEAIDWLGVTKPSLRALDEMAMIITLALFLVSTVGVKFAVRHIRRRTTTPSSLSKP